MIAAEGEISSLAVTMFPQVGQRSFSFFSPVGLITTFLYKIILPTKSYPAIGDLALIKLSRIQLIERTKTLIMTLPSISGPGARCGPPQQRSFLGRPFPADRSGGPPGEPGFTADRLLQPHQGAATRSMVARRQLYR